MNRAWGTKQYPWWRMPIKNLSMTAILASALLLGSIIPTIFNYVEVPLLEAFLAIPPWIFIS